MSDVVVAVVAVCLYTTTRENKSHFPQQTHIKTIDKKKSSASTEGIPSWDNQKDW